ncbi:VanZ family protein [Thermophilibacter sp.]
MGLLSRFLGSFSDSFALALALWPLASLALTLPILALLYHRDGRLRAWSAVGAYLSVLYALSLVCFTLYPLPEGTSGPGITYGVPPQLNPLGFVADLARDGVSAVPQILANVAFFVPFGVIARRGPAWGAPRTAALALMASFTIETAQLTGLFGIYPHAYRTFDVDDLAWNVGGAMIGWGLARLVERVLPPAGPERDGAPTTEPGLVRRGVAWCLDMALVGGAWVLVGSLARLALAALGLDARVEELLAPLETGVLGAVFLVVEGVVPWLRGGETPGGGFVRMTCETHPRSGLRRALFYGLRLACLALVPLTWPFCALSWLVARRMPYDLV